jgi:hypothetical protein
MAFPTARSANKAVRTGYVYLHSAVDDYSRLAYTEHLPDEKAVTAIGFMARARAFFAAHSGMSTGRSESPRFGRLPRRHRTTH